MLELTILGSAGSHPGVGRLCSGYLVRSGSTSLLLDAGNGSTANLQRLLPYRSLDAIVISHRHVDHCVDLIGAFYALRFGDPLGRRIPLFGAAEVHAMLTGMLSTDTAMDFDEVFAHQQVGDGDTADVGPMQLHFADSIHSVPTVSTRIEVGGASLVYSGDSAGGPMLVDLARGADLLLCEATWTGDAEDHPPGMHLTGRGAADIAREAGVGRLVLTHIAGATDRAQLLAEARERFDGPIDLAEELRTYVLA